MHCTPYNPMIYNISDAACTRKHCVRNERRLKKQKRGKLEVFAVYILEKYIHTLFIQENRTRYILLLTGKTSENSHQFLCFYRKTDPCLRYDCYLLI